MQAQADVFAVEGKKTGELDGCSVNADQHVMRTHTAIHKLIERWWRGGEAEAEMGLLMDGWMSQGETDA